MNVMLYSSDHHGLRRALRQLLWRDMAPYSLSPLDNPVAMLILTLVIGVAHILPV